MEVIILTIMIFSLTTVITVDTRQKRRAFMNQHRDEQ